MISPITIDSFNIMKRMEFDGESRKDRLLSAHNRVIHNINSELKPSIFELKEKMSICNILNCLKQNVNNKVKNKNIREIYRLNKFPIFIESFNKIIDKVLEKDIDVTTSHLNKLLYRDFTPVETYNDLLEIKEDIKEYWNFLNKIGEDNFFNLGLIDEEDVIIKSAYRSYIYYHIGSDLVFIFGTLNNNFAPLLGKESFILKNKKFTNNINTYSLSMEAVDDDDDSDTWDEGLDDDEEESDKKEPQETVQDLDNKIKPTDSNKQVDEKGMINKVRKFFSTVKNNVAAIPSKVRLITKKIQLFMRDRKHLKFFQRYRGKFEGLWEQYARDVNIEENEFLGDPVKIITEKMPDYIISFGKTMCVLSDEIQKLADEVEKAPFDKKIQLVKEYSKEAPSKDEKGHELTEDKMAKRIYLATKKKLSQIIFNQEAAGGRMRIYGFTEESVTVGQLPPPNHLIVSLIVNDPFKDPQERPLTEIFDDWESFNILTDSNKQKLFSTQELANAVLKNSINVDTFKKMETNRKNLVAGLKTPEFKTVNNKEAKRRKKMTKQIANGLSQSVKTMGKMKIYLMECINIYFSVILRVDDLAYNAVNLMLKAEEQGNDKRYDSELGAGGSRKDLDKARDFIEKNTRI